MSDWRGEEIARERDYAEREQYRARSKMTREERLAEVAEMVENGSLVVRTVTAAVERARYGMPPATEEPRQIEVSVLEETSNLQSPNLSSSQRAAREVAVAAAGVTAAELAAAAHVSLRTVERAQRVQASDPELFQRLLSGEISATAAAQEVSSR